MKIRFFGAARTVTGSMHLLEVNGARILLECGLYQGKRNESFQRNRNLPFDAVSVDVMVLSHAHIDHSGNIPNLVKSGFHGNIHCTYATRDLCSIMLRDSAHIMESDVKYINRRRARKNQPLIEPVYTTEDAVASLRHFTSMDYGRKAYIAPGVELTFFDAGHILGSALVCLDITEGERRFRLLFTGDLGRYDLPILRDPQPVEGGTDYLISESTYGGRLHGTAADAEVALRDIINGAYNRGGKVIIPAFSVGRTQEIVYALHRLHNQGDIPGLPIYVDSPLAINATEVFRLHPEYYDEETHQFMLEYRDPFGFGRLRYVRRTEDSKAINDVDGPIVIISASGMCEGGRVLHHLKNNIQDANNTVLIVGFQAQHTLGRRILDREETVKIFGDRYNLRARVERIDGYSAHADHNELLRWVGGLGTSRIKHAFLVHGEDEGLAAYKEGLHGIGVRQTTIPSQGDEVTL